jgi:hypothetical protein
MWNAYHTPYFIPFPLSNLIYFSFAMLIDLYQILAAFGIGKGFPALAQ